jgi:hypothetical protein
LTINAQRLWAKSVHRPFFPLAICWSPRSDPNPKSSISQAQIFNGRPKSSYSGKSHPLKVHSVLLFRFPFFFCLFLIGSIHRAFDSHWG